MHTHFKQSIMCHFILHFILTRLFENAFSKMKFHRLNIQYAKYVYIIYLKIHVRSIHTIVIKHWT